MRFRNKILLAIWAVVLGAQVITLAIIQYWIREQVRSRFADELTASYSTLREITSLRARQDVRSCQVIAESPRLKAVAELKDKETALQLLRELHQELLSDLFVLTDARGHPLVQLIDGLERLDLQPGTRSVSRAMAMQPEADIWHIGDSSYRVATVPVTVGPDLVGTITIGFRLRQEDVAFVRSMTGSDVVLVRDTTALLAAFSGQAEIHLAGTIAQQVAPRMASLYSEPGVFTLAANGEVYVATFCPLGSNENAGETGSGYVLLKPLEREVQAALAPVLRAFAVISLGVLLIAAVVGYLVSRSITRPIAALVQGTTEVSRGNYDYRIDVHSGGELRFLGQKFEEMSGSLKEKVSELNERNVELELALKKWKETQGRFQAILDTSPALVFVKDLQGRYLLVNRKFETVFSLAVTDVEGKTDKELFSKQVADEMCTNDRKIIQGGKVLEWEQVIRSDKKLQTYIANKFALYDAAGTMYGLGGVMTDVTERKVLEEQLRQAQKLESLGTLAGGVAHDFNNILGIILAQATLLEQRAVEGERLQQSINSISRAVDRGTGLVRQLLTFARKTDVLFESVSVNQIIEELVHMLGAMFPKNILFEMHLDGDLPPVTADSNQLHQALLNLSVNARDVMPAGGTLSFSTAIVPGDQLREQIHGAVGEHYVRVSVGDTGSGMNEQTKKRIFEPFFTTKGIGKGTGLGLAVVYGVVNSHNGFIDLESELGRGTKFHLYFPAALRETAIPDVLRERVADIKGGNESILIVEDEELLLEVLKRLLETKGYDVLTAMDGAEALEVYRTHQQKIALVITDLGLPRLGGWELVREIREMNTNVKIIVASGYFDPDVRQEMKNAAASEFVQKPYLPQQVLKRVREVIDAG